MSASELEADADLLTHDNVHVSSLLGYLVANVMFETVFKEAPPGPDAYMPPFASRADAELMQAEARTAVRDHGILFPGQL